MNIVITSLFGLERLVREDLEAIGYDSSDISVSDGVVVLKVADTSEALATAVARTNMWVRRGERVYFEVGSFTARTFDEYFDGFASISWGDYIPRDYSIIINGFSRKSDLFGIPACQSLGKKAIIKSLQAYRGLGPNSIINEDRDVGEIKIQFGIVNNIVSVMIETSGDGLHKRGYRPLTHDAPIKETLAAGMVSLARYSPFGNEALVDPFCGSGTILIEAALMAVNAAPGRSRHFAYEKLPYIGANPYKLALEEAHDLEDFTPLDDMYFIGSDIDPKAISNARNNARMAGLESFISFSVMDAARRPSKLLPAQTGFDRNLVLTNPPYGGRLLTEEEAARIYQIIRNNYLGSDGHCLKGCRLSVITPDDTFETVNQIKADKRVKLYNGNIRCQLNNFYKLSKD